MNRVILYEDDEYILLKDKDHDAGKYPQFGPYSFGLKKELSAWGFPVEQSCLTKEVAIEQLNLHIRLGEEHIAKYEKKFTGGAEEYIQVCRSMIDALNAD